MTRNMVFQKIPFKEILLFLSLLVSEVTSDDGICTRHEVTSKVRPRSFIKYMTETYIDYNCLYSYSYGYRNCNKERNIPKQVTELERYTALEVKQYCCAGYKNTRSEIDLECTPVCEFECSNGKCSKPNYCECKSGYFKKPGTENICEPVCSVECVHGFCSHPESCSCDYGYEHQSNSTYICSPVCSNSCINANCTSPDICTCFKGFAKTLQEMHKCHPVCLPHCVNGVCTSPNECTCFEGYGKENFTQNVCNPVCPGGCDNGVCTAPGECTCFDGFENIKGNCEPKCSQECLNGLCTGPDVCTCHSGYQHFLDNPYSCFPVCSPGCENSNCTKPDRCECFPGFEESDDPNVCRPYCTDGCENGICVQPEECTCLWGYRSQSNSSICTQQERLSCIFSNELLHHNFDKYCFKFTSKLYLTNSSACAVFQYLVSQIEVLGNSNLYFFCDGVSDLELFENRFKLRLECNANLSKTEKNLTDNEFVSSSAYIGEKDLSDFTEPTILTSSLETSNTTEDQVSSTASEMQSTTDEVLFSTSSRNILGKSEFNITQIGLSSIATQLSTFPLDLNINLKFSSLIKYSHISQGYFDQMNHSKREVCLCHQNEKSWTICASNPVELHLCPCQLTKSQMRESKTELAAKTITKTLLVLVFGLLVGYILYATYQSRSYEVTRNQTPTSDHRNSVLLFDFVSLDSNNREEVEN